ncbi:MAG: DUF262 domain-containing protein [Gemmatimonadales bacterium]|nr:DUF262 domain-containing protein [Candidatus Palauibacter irciniicola]MYC17580.1 DUF262 domain-containing protein [Gemmatimonadales bacterium]
MKITLRKVTVAELVEGYRDDREGGVFGYGDKLDIRPPYQREFIYGPRERNAVIHSILKDFPLNVMYWADREDGTFEVIDGQQRTISIAQYVEGDFSINEQYFYNLLPDIETTILDYELMVYVCTGTDSEKLEWFRTINIAGKKLTPQELRNAVYSGPWVSDAKRYFSRIGHGAHGLASDYLAGSAIRQEYLETAIKWISGGEIEDYMARHQHDADAKALWAHFRNVIDWVDSVFKTRPNLMRGVDWGGLYDAHKDAEIDKEWVEAETKRLITDDDVERQRGIYGYLLDGDERHLRIRAFSPTMKRRAYEAQGGKCTACGDEFMLAQMEADHITPWRDKGATVQENCQVLCRDCNRRKGAK